jgi:hypothetical protein
MIIRISRGIAAPMLAPISTPVQSFGESDDSGGGVAVAATTIEGRLAADTSVEDNGVANLFEVEELGEADEPGEVDDD